ncbi:hypothetical protein A2U01_0019372, partial [Trifolium medium]|nr:hypothetical protein [Trifolium medium]
YGSLIHENHDMGDFSAQDQLSLKDSAIGRTLRVSYLQHTFSSKALFGLVVQTMPSLNLRCRNSTFLSRRKPKDQALKWLIIEFKDQLSSKHKLLGEGSWLL